jgi:adenylate kinase
MVVRLIILGGPGAGKGTQAERLSKTLNLPRISTGDILREAIAAGTELGKQVQAQVEQGELVPDQAMIQLIRERLLQSDVAQGWLLDGYPRTAFQAEELDFLLDDLQQHLDQAIWLEVSESMLMSRSLGQGRVDDTESAIQRRITLFAERTTPLTDYYEFGDRLLRINGDQAIEAVEQEIIRLLGQ